MAEDDLVRPIKLPDQIISDLADLIEDPSFINAVVRSAGKASPAASIRGFSKRVARDGGLDPTKTLSVLSTLANIRRMQRARDADPAQMMRTLTVSLEKHAPEKWKQDNLDNWKKVSPDIQRAFENIDADHPLFVSEKAETLAYSHQNVLTSQRIITDIRPVFSQDGTEIKELVILHTLLVDHFDGVAHPRRIAFTLDSADIADLRRLCERAETKAKAALEALRSFNPVEIPDDLDDVDES